MSKIQLSLALFLTGTLACSSSSSTTPDGGDASTKDGATSETGADGAKPSPSDGSADGSGDASVDGVVLTPLQARGSYLVNAVIACSDCHTPSKADGSPDFSKFLAGNPGFITLPNGDKLGSRNLTNDATGLKTRSDAEIKAMILDGKRPGATGTSAPEALNPVMPYYVFHNMTGEDADAIVAYLRTVPGVTNEIPRRAAAFDVAAPANYLSADKIPLPVASATMIDSALRGRYLAAESGLCIECHTQHKMTADVLDLTKLFAGGEDYSALFAATLKIKPVSKNLTSDVTGLSTWTAADIVKVLTDGKAKDGSGICPPMPSGPMGAYGHLTHEDATDIANYIKSLPPIANTVVDMCSFPPPAPPADGGADGATSEAGASEGGPSDAAVSEVAPDAVSTDAVVGN